MNVNCMNRFLRLSLDLLGWTKKPNPKLALKTRCPFKKRQNPLPCSDARCCSPAIPVPCRAREATFHSTATEWWVRGLRVPGGTGGPWPQWVGATRDGGWPVKPQPTPSQIQRHSVGQTFLFVRFGRWDGTKAVRGSTAVAVLSGGCREC